MRPACASPAICSGAAPPAPTTAFCPPSSGSHAAKLVEAERYGVTVAMVNGRVVENRLEDVAGKSRNIPESCDLLTVAPPDGY